MSKPTRLYSLELSLPPSPLHEDQSMGVVLTYEDNLFNLYVQSPFLHTIGTGQYIEDFINNNLTDQKLSQLVKQELSTMAESCKSQANILMKHYRHLLETAKNVGIKRLPIDKRADVGIRDLSTSSDHSSHSTPRSAVRATRASARSSGPHTHRQPAVSDLDLFDGLDGEDDDL